MVCQPREAWPPCPGKNTEGAKGPQETQGSAVGELLLGTGGEGGVMRAVVLWAAAPPFWNLLLPGTLGIRPVLVVEPWG